MGDYLSAEASGASENSDQPDSSDEFVDTDLHIRHQ
jgi:hypothetical protein